MANLAYHRGPLVQRGRGIGSIFQGLSRFFIPLAKSVIKSPTVRKLAKSAGREAFSAGLGATADLLEGKDARPGMKRSFDKTRHSTASVIRKKASQVAAAPKVLKKKKTPKFKKRRVISGPHRVPLF